MREREAKRWQVSSKCPADEIVGADARIVVDEELRKAVGCCWPVRITPGIAKLVAPTEEGRARGESHDSRLRDLLWLAGIALSEMDAHDRVAPFDMVLAGKTVRLAACFDTTDDLNLQIIVAEELEWGRGVDAREPGQSRFDR